MEPPQREKAIEGVGPERGKVTFVRLMGMRFLVEVESVADDTIAVTFPGSSYPVEGLPAELEFHDLNGVKTYYVQVVSGPRKPGDSMILRRTTSLTRKHHRRGWRVPLNAVTELRKPFDATGHRTLLVDISSEGALAETNGRFEVGDVVEFPLCLPLQSSHVVTGRIVRRDEHVPSEGPHRYGLLFLDTPPPAREALTRFIWDQIRRLYPKELRAQFPGHGKRKKMKKQLKHRAKRPNERARP